MSSEERLDAYHFYERDWESSKQLRDAFEWQVPDPLNVAEYVCDRWVSDGDRVALHHEDHEGTQETVTYRELRDRSNRVANFLAANSVVSGDRIGVNTAPRPWALAFHLAAWKLGAVSIPLSTLFGPQGLGYRLDDADAVVCLVDEWNVDTLREVRGEHPALEMVVTLGNINPEADEISLADAVKGHSTEFEVVTTAPTDEFLQPYTSGTTGSPKGAVYEHQVLLGHLPHYVATFCNMAVEDDDVFYSNADWAWVYGLVSVTCLSLFYGTPVVSFNGGEFDPERTFELLERYGVTNFPTTPTTLKMMMDVESALDRFDLSDLRLVATGGESIGKNVVDWVTDSVDATFHELYGQTEMNLLVGDCTALFEFREGSIGRPSPGHDVRIVDPDTAEPTVPDGEVGEIALRYADDPVCFAGYWNIPDVTAAKLKENGWAVTGDLGVRDEDGYFTFLRRKDDTIISAGYTIGPDEIEDCLASHEAVLDAGVIGVPDDERGEVPMAFVVLAADWEPSPALERELTQYVKERLAKYEYPRRIAFIEELPRTTTGKVRRVELKTRVDEGVTGEE